VIGGRKQSVRHFAKSRGRGASGKDITNEHNFDNAAEQAAACRWLAESTEILTA
jgi:hypothetical protein